MDRRFGTLGAVFGFLAVAVGAFGAHALRARLPLDMLDVWETAARYQMYHALALFAVGIFAPRAGAAARVAAAAGWLFAAGIVLFSGSLYALALTGVRDLGAITPLGGLALLAGWACAGVAAFRSAS